jgi:hypothetical protein
VKVLDGFGFHEKMMSIFEKIDEIDFVFHQEFEIFLVTNIGDIEFLGIDGVHKRNEIIVDGMQKQQVIYEIHLVNIDRLDF